MKTLTISFDDGLVDQLKWARTLSTLRLHATFYVSPALLGTGYLARKRWIYLTERHLDTIASLGHTVGNHLWSHECPKCGCRLEELMTSALRAEEWLVRKYGERGKPLALPYGSRGGAWQEPHLEALRSAGFVVRDVRQERNGGKGAWESTELPLEDADSRYFHGNHNTTDNAFAEFAYAVAALRDKGELTVT